MTTAGEFHNRLAPEILTLLLAPIANGHGTAATMVLLESVICAAVYSVTKYEGNTAPEAQRNMLATLFDGAVNRMADFNQRRQDSGE